MRLPTSALSLRSKVNLILWDLRSKVSLKQWSRQIITLKWDNDKFGNNQVLFLKLRWALVCHDFGGPIQFTFYSKITMYGSLWPLTREPPSASILFKAANSIEVVSLIYINQRCYATALLIAQCYQNINLAIDLRPIIA